MMFLLRCGAMAGPLYLAIGLAQALTRESFDVRRHALSLLSDGDPGWVQIASVLVSGVLVMAGAAGLRPVLVAERGGIWGPRLLAVYGVGLIGAGMFVADPGGGFPPGMPAPGQLTRSGFLHAVFGAIGFYALIGGCLVFARHFRSAQQPGWLAYSLVTGAGFFAAVAAIASGSTAAVTILAFYVAVAWAWIWHCALHVKFLLEERTVMAAPAALRPGS